MKNCKFCGKEISDEMDFCLYCMKKQNEDIILNKPSTKNKKFILIPIICVVLVLGIVLGVVVNKLPIKIVDKQISFKNNAVVTLDGLNPYDESSDLTDRQKTILKFFGYNYTFINDDTVLSDTNYLSKDFNIGIEGQLEKFIESDEENFSCLITKHPEMKDSLIELKGYFIVKGKFNDNYHLTRGNRYNFYGKTAGFENVDFGEQTLEIPVINLDYYDDYNNYFGAGVNNITQDQLEITAKAMFGNKTTLREAILDKDFEIDDYHDNEYIFQYIIPENQSVDLFKKIEMPTTGGFLVANTPGEFSRIYFSTDFKNIFVVRINRAEIKLYIECYDTNFNQLWNNSFNYPFDYVQIDYNSQRIYFESQGLFYYINIKDGSVSKNTAQTGYFDYIKVVEDGVLAFCKTDNSFIKLDLNGNILWTVYAENPTTSCYNIACNNGTYLFSTAYYDEQFYEYNEYITIVDKDGKILSTIENNKY